MKILLLLHLFFAPQSGCLQRYNPFNQIGKPHLTWNGKINSGHTVMRPPPLHSRNLFGLKNKGQGDGVLATEIKVQGTARLSNGKVKIDLIMQGPNGKLGYSNPGVVSTATVLTSASTPPTTSATLATAATNATTMGSPGTISTASAPPTSATTGPTTLASGPTTLPATTSTGATSATALSTASTSSTGPTTLPTSMSMAPTSLTTGPTSAPAGTTLPTSKQTTPFSAATSVQTTIPAVTTVATTLPTLPVSRPSPPQLPGVPSKPTCEAPVNVNIIILAKEVLKDHNSYRRTHGSPEMQLDEQMTCDAQKFAQEIAFKGVLRHQSSDILARKRLGENIGMSCAPLRDGPLSYGRMIKMAKNVAKRWYDEVCQYNFDKPSSVPRTGHFTEIVWSGSRKLGIGYAVGKNPRFPGYECVYVVGRYKPAGNVIGGQRLKTNVKRGSFNTAYCQRRSGINSALPNAPGFHGILWDKRNQLKYKERKEAGLQAKRRRLALQHQSRYRIYSHYSK